MITFFVPQGMTVMSLIQLREIIGVKETNAICDLLHAMSLGVHLARLCKTKFISVFQGGFAYVFHEFFAEIAFAHITLVSIRLDGDVFAIVLQQISNGGGYDVS